MELDDLKAQFLNTMQQPVIHITRLHIQGILKKKSFSTINVLKRNLRMELLFAILFFAFPAYLFITQKGLFISLFACLISLFIVDFIIRVGRLLMAIQRYEQSVNAIRQHLRMFRDIMNKFTHLYFISTMMMMPLLFTAAFLFVHLDNLQKEPALFITDYRITLLFYITGSLAWSIAMYFFTKWWLRKLYGKHLKHLKELVSETGQL